MIIELLATFVNLCLAIDEMVHNPRQILKERAHIGYSEEHSEQTSEEPEDQNEEESELPYWDIFDD